MEHKFLFMQTIQTINELLIIGRAEGCNRNRLCFTTGEQG